MPLEVAGKLLWRHNGGAFRIGDVGAGGPAGKQLDSLPGADVTH